MSEYPQQKNKYFGTEFVEIRNRGHSLTIDSRSAGGRPDLPGLRYPGS